MTSKEITELGKRFFNTDFTIKSRKRKFIYMRALCNVLSKKHTKETLNEISNNYKNYDHCSVLHSISEFNKTYISQTDPFDVKYCYETLDNMIIRLIKEEKKFNKDEYDKIMLYEKKLHEANLKCSELKKQLNITRINLKYYRNKNSNVDTRFKDVLNELKDLSDIELLEFTETRLKPFKKSIKSRVEQKQINHIPGAKINRHQKLAS